jgi:hypothetical protein
MGGVAEACIEELSSDRAVVFFQLGDAWSDCGTLEVGRRAETAPESGQLTMPRCSRAFAAKTDRVLSASKCSSCSMGRPSGPEA